jgi:hypothetical protein
VQYLGVGAEVAMSFGPAVGFTVGVGVGFAVASGDGGGVGKGEGGIGVGAAVIYTVAWVGAGVAGVGS